MILTQGDRLMLNKVSNMLYKEGEEGEKLSDKLYNFVSKIEKLDETFKKLYGGK